MELRHDLEAMTPGVVPIEPWQISYIVLNAVPEVSTPIRYPCLLCRQPQPITPGTRQSIADLRKAKRFYIVLCNDCWPLFAPHLQSDQNLVVGGNPLFRTLGGLDR